MSQHSSTRFSPLALLMVVGVVTLLAALAVPAIQRARESARRMSCGNNLKQVGIGIHNYHDTFKAFPAGWLPAHAADPLGAESWAWSVPILPFTS
jgi:hypothetical protein